jgi:RimJ/RimL family protein N-acetyltransferase
VRIEADGCALRTVRESDVPAIVAGMHDPEIVYWLAHLPHPYTPDDARNFIISASSWLRDGRDASFAIVDEDDAFLGIVGVRASEDPPQVGYWVAPEARRRGIATSATNAISDWAFLTFACSELELRAEPTNIASTRVAARCGYLRMPGSVVGAGDRELWVFRRQRDP